MTLRALNVFVDSVNAKLDIIYLTQHVKNVTLVIFHVNNVIVVYANV